MATRTDVNEVFGADGQRVTFEQVIVDTTGETNDKTIRAALNDGLTALQTIIDAPDVTFTFANLADARSQLQAAVRQNQAAHRAQARQIRRLTFLALGLLDRTD
jgi:hypothetical protein